MRLAKCYCNTLLERLLYPRPGQFAGTRTCPIPPWQQSLTNRPRLICLRCAGKRTHSDNIRIVFRCSSTQQGTRLSGTGSKRVALIRVALAPRRRRRAFGREVDKAGCSLWKRRARSLRPDDHGFGFRVTHHKCFLGLLERTWSSRDIFHRTSRFQGLCT